jgi:hypothetical protein
MIAAVAHAASSRVSRVADLSTLHESALKTPHVTYASNSFSRVAQSSVRGREPIEQHVDLRRRDHQRRERTVDPFGFKFQWTTNSSKHIPFD